MSKEKSIKALNEPTAKDYLEMAEKFKAEGDKMSKIYEEGGKYAEYAKHRGNNAYKQEKIAREMATKWIQNNKLAENEENNEPACCSNSNEEGYKKVSDISLDLKDDTAYTDITISYCTSCGHVHSVDTF